MEVNRGCSFSRLNCDKIEAERILRYKNLTVEIHRVWDVKTKSVTGNNRDNWSHLKTIQKISGQHTGK